MWSDCCAIVILVSSVGLQVPMTSWVIEWNGRNEILFVNVAWGSKYKSGVAWKLVWLEKTRNPHRRIVQWKKCFG